MSARAALFWGSLGAAIAALVAALRVQRWPVAFLVLFGAGALAFGPVAALLTRPSTKQVDAGRTKQVAFPASAVVVGLALVTPVLAGLLGALKSSTHHRPLGAVTFAIMAAFAVVGASSFALWLFNWAGDEARPLARALRRLVLALAVAGPVLLLLRAASSAALRDGVFDVSLALGSAFALRLIPWPEVVERSARAAGLALWCAAVALALAVGVSAGVEPASEASFALAAPLVWMLR